MDADYARDRVLKKQLVFRYNVRARIACAMVRKYLKLKGPVRLLDFGCAEGRTLLKIRDILGEGEFTGVEYSKELLSHAPELPAGVKLIQGDVMSLPGSIKEGYYDVVTAMALLEHLKDPVSALKEAKRVMNPKGIIIITCPNPLLDHISGKLRLVKDEYHMSNMDRSTTFSLLESCGFDILEYHKFMFAPIGLLPYMGIPLGSVFSLKVDYFLAKLRIFNWLFVNQCIVARKTDASLSASAGKMVRS